MRRSNQGSRARLAQRMSEHREKDKASSRIRRGFGGFGGFGGFEDSSTDSDEEVESLTPAARAWGRYDSSFSGRGRRDESEDVIWDHVPDEEDEGDLDSDSIPFEQSMYGDTSPIDEDTSLYGTLSAYGRTSSADLTPRFSKPIKRRKQKKLSEKTLRMLDVPKEVQERAQKRIEYRIALKTREIAPPDIAIRNQVISTEYGDSFRVIPSGLKRGQHSLQLRGEGEEETIKKCRATRKLELKKGIDPMSPLTEDGYKNEEERRTKRAFRPEYTIEVNRRIDVLQDHPDYDFLSMVAAELDLDVEETFVKTSATRAQAAARAMSDQIASRALTRQTRLEMLSSNLIEARKSLEVEEARKEVQTIPNDQELFDLVDKMNEKDYYIDALNKFQVFLLNIRRGVIEEENPSSILLDGSDDDTDIKRLSWDLTTETYEELMSDSENFLIKASLQFSAVYFYLTNLSASSEFVGIRKVLNLYDRLKGQSQHVESLRDLMFFYASLDFLGSVTLTHPTLSGVGSIKEEGSETNPTDRIRILIDLKKEDPNSKDHPDKAAWVAFAPMTRGRKDQATNVLKFLLDEVNFGDNDERGAKEDYTLEELFDFLKSNWYEGITSTDHDKHTAHDQEVQHWFGFLHLIYAYNERVYRLINQLFETNQTLMGSAFGFGEEEGSWSYLASNAFGLFDGNDLMIESALAMGITVDTSIQVDLDNYEYWQTVMEEYVSKKRSLLENIDKRIAKLKQRVSDINTELQIREVEGGAPETGGVTSVPITANPEWAMKAINTGILRIERKFVSAIEQAHTHFKRYFARVRRPEWAKIDREIIQRDELMGPLFASLCATFVSRAKIGNPRRYMRDGMERERVLKKASLMQDMMDLRYVPGANPRFVSRR